MHAICIHGSTRRMAKVHVSYVASRDIVYMTGIRAIHALVALNTWPVIGYCKPSASAPTNLLCLASPMLCILSFLQAKLDEWHSQINHAYCTLTAHTSNLIKS